jgi:hypothetical protein
VGNVCAESVNSFAIDACQKSNDAKSAAVLGWVFVAAGAALGGTGAWLVLAAPYEPAREPAATRTSRRGPVEFVPMLGPRMQSLDLRIRF